jgi:hypothetical protein
MSTLTFTIIRSKDSKKKGERENWWKGDVRYFEGRLINGEKESEKIRKGREQGVPMLCSV